ncbi:dihydrofolate reductase family protein [Streptomyces sp. NPDC047072]|uniref:dihydrofolate reductase family protein n=1 Tax=Streptomyces sp. NPDC047072 TaxID=3154809 RepID=UPI0033E4216C
MRKIVLIMSVSLDGYIEADGRDISWHRVDDELHTHMNDMVGRLGGLLSGRVTHELMAEYWPTADEAPDASPIEVEFARIWRDMPKVVYSRTLTHADWNTEIVREVVPEEVRELKARPGGDLGLGGAALAREFLRLGLLDEMRIYVHPVLVGSGTALFPKPDAGDGAGAGATDLTALRLLESHTFGNGVVLLRYALDK